MNTFSRIKRRDFLKSIGVCSIGFTLPKLFGIDFNPEFQRLIPAEKNLDPMWVKSLFERGEREVYQWHEAKYAGMPVGGICCGQLYLGADGKLWYWDIFNKVYGTGADHYANPLKPESPLVQGFAVSIKTNNDVQLRALDHTGWEKISFIGEYPIGFVEYDDSKSPVKVKLEAFSPFIPLNPEDSALPVTIMKYTIENKSSKKIACEIGGWLENAVCINSADEISGIRKNRIIDGAGFKFLDCTAEFTSPSDETKPDIVFEDFESGTYNNWQVSGDAFGKAPVEKSKIPAYQGDVGGLGNYVVNSHASAPGNTVEEKDSHVGELLSKEFIIERNYITFFVGGGAHKNRTCVNLLVQGKPVLSATGKNDNRMSRAVWNVRKWKGQKARIQIVDSARESWGNIGVDHIVFTDNPAVSKDDLKNLPDYGSMGLALITGGDKENIRANAALPSTNIPPGIFAHENLAVSSEAESDFDKKLIGALSKVCQLEPGQSKEITFIIAWYFPNIKIEGLGDTQGRHYGKRFKSAFDVAQYVANNIERLSKETRLWHDTWYDSSLPYWFLDRTFATVSHLATNTCYWFGNGRFYGWEGVGCCAGTCTHVWHYAQAPARLFPQLEKYLREHVDYGVAFDPQTGRIRFRAEHNNHWAVDGQSGVILRTYREHQMSSDSDFLKRVWQNCKKSIQFLIDHDVNKDGIIDGPQHNTLDTDWFGEIAWLSGMYISALRAGQLMALEMGDTEFAKLCEKIYESGKKRIETDLFNGEYFINKVDEKRLDTINSGLGCHIDQVLGDAWAEQLGFAPILDNDKVKSALKSLWKYNFCPDVGPWRQANKPGRWYAMAGEAGLIMCTFPIKGWDYSRAKGKGPDWAAGYFNECMTGFEYQAAWHMISKGLLLEGLAVTRAIHDRYHPSKRNPWNEVECGDHYARAMASYGVFLAICGFTCHSPKGFIEFNPKLKPENFKAAFTTATGWGSYSQKTEPNLLHAKIEAKWGNVAVKTISIGLPDKSRAVVKHTITVNKKEIPSQTEVKDGKLVVNLEQRVELKPGDIIELNVSF